MSHILDTIIDCFTSFLMAKLHIDSLAAKLRPRDVRRALSHLPKELDKTYDEAKARILGQGEDNLELAKQVLGWIMNAKRPLTVVELQHAIAVTIDDRQIDETYLFTEADLFSEGDLVFVCAGIVTVDPQSNVIRLVHYTTEEYFERLGEKELSLSQATMAKTCLTYIGLTGIEGPCSNSELTEIRVGKWKFSQYAAQFWGLHTRGEAENDIRCPAGSSFTFGIRKQEELDAAIGNIC